MLCELFIENLAVIEKADIQFHNGLNVFTGETGAGKSIMIDAINAVLGQRSSKDLVRFGAKKASVSAVFKDIDDNVLSKLSEYGYETENGELLISREISVDGKGSARIMGRPVTVSILKEIGTELINIHGQHDNQILLSSDRHMDILDSFGDYEALKAEYEICYKNVVRIKKEMRKISISEEEKERKIDLLSYQIDEIEKADLKIGEDEQAEELLIQYKNSSKIVHSLKEVSELLYGDDSSHGALDLIKMASNALLKIADFYTEAEKLDEKIQTAIAELEDVDTSLSDSLDSFDFSESELERLQDRLAEIRTLKRKYGESIEEILKFKEDAQNELSTLELSQKRLLELNDEGQKEYAKLLNLANRLSKAREDAGNLFILTVSKELEFLDMPNVKVQVSHQKVKPNLKGQDQIEFLISTNKGEPPKPIAKIASGGELSRIMLAIKNTLADKDRIQTLIFDEVDTGVSGRAAQKIGLKLKQASKGRQIFAVTHLAQIAALANHHYLIKKDSDDIGTYTKVTELDFDGRVSEVARIMSTGEITDLMLENAKEMINNGMDI